ncbi:hypothetical protein LIER_37819 [Lithospermum erythrorhizon]|uniref:Uncharacterized protein n=1 Tax=Lithospermum erythrorhizon TaxID=34254 RepID=A0AAV3PW64_LITER
MKAPYILPNGLSIEDGHLWNNRMEAFHVGHPPLLVDMIKAFNASYAYTRQELLKEMSFEKALKDLEAAQVSLKKRDEELTSCKEALSAEKWKCRKLQEQKQAMELEHPKRGSLAGGRIQRQLRGNLFVSKESSTTIFGFVTKFLSDFPQLAGMYNEFKKAWPAEYFEDLSVDSSLAETPAENTEVASEGDEVAADVGDDATP